MTDDEFDEFVATTNAALYEKQSSLEHAYRLGRHARWDFDATTGFLHFSDGNGVLQVEAAVTQIGTFSTATRTWRWAWSNQSTPEAARIPAARIRELYELTGVEIFRREKFEADEQMAWELAAMAVAHLSAAGAYRGVAGHLFVFLAIDDIRAVAKPS